MGQYAACLFDFDYTLGDATEGNLLCMVYALKRMGLPEAGREEMIRTIGLSLPDTYEALTGDGDARRAEVFADLFREEADRVMVAHTSLYPQTLPTLRALRQQGSRLGVVTTKFAYRIRDIMEQCGEVFCWDCVVGRENVDRPKPDPEGLLSAVRQLSLLKEQVLYLGDSLVDAQAAQRAGVDFVAVTTGTTPAAAFTRYPCRAVLSDIGGLLGEWDRLTRID